jgi:DNA invertase Pin-like site-specific DNA recombinase
MANIGYIRVSTDKQDLEQQKGIIERYILDKKMILDNSVGIEISSRKTLEDRKINELFNMLKENDNLLVSEISRLARSIKELEIIFDTFKKMKVNVILIKEGLTVDHKLDNPMNKMFIQILGIFAEFERNNISYRTKQALKSKTNLGHNKKYLKNSFDKYENEIIDYKKKKLPFSNICILLNSLHDTQFKAPALNKWFNSRYNKDITIKKEWQEHKEGV